MVRDRSTSVKEPRDPGGHGVAINVLFNVWSVSRAAGDLLDATLAPTGLDADEYAVYSLLAKSRKVTPTDLARWMAAPPTTVSSYLKRLEARGHVRREINPDDRRSHLILLTPAGNSAHRKAAAAFAPTLGQVAEALGGRESGVLEALADLRAALDAVRAAGRAG